MENSIGKSVEGILYDKDHTLLEDFLGKENNKMSQTEEKFRFLADNIPQIVWESDAYGQPVYYNKAWFDFTGLSFGENLRQAQVIHPDDLLKIRENFKISLTAKTPFEMEIRVKCADGNYKWFLTRSVPFLNLNGDIERWLGTSTDINEKKKQELRENFISSATSILISSIDYETTLKNLAYLAVPDFCDWCSIYMTEPDGIRVKRVVVAHQDPEKVRETIGYNQRFHIRLDEPGLIPGIINNGKPVLISEIDDPVIKEASRDDEQLKILKSAGLKSLLSVPIIIKGKPVGVIGFITTESGRILDFNDLITAERLSKKASLAIENALLYKKSTENEQLLRLVTDALPALISYVDNEERYIFNNKAYETWLGIPRDSIAGKKIREIASKEMYEILSPHLKSVLAGNTVTYEARVPYKIGEKYVRVSYIPHKEGEKVLGFFVLVEDLNEQKIAENNLEIKNSELMVSNEQLDRFAYIASHDLQEPLRMVSSYVQLLAKRYKDLLDEDANEFINFTVEGVQRMKIMIQSLLEYSRLDKNFSPGPTDLNQVLEFVKLKLQKYFFESNIVINYLELPVIYCDRVKISLVLYNLIDNAIKFKKKEEDLIITISSKKQENMWLIEVKDNGMGINKDYFEKIFIFFQRLHNKNDYPGIGSGLAVCKKIIELHKGKIWVESEEGKGCKFLFTLPYQS